MSIIYRQTDEISDMHRIVELEKIVWGLPDVDCVPVNVLRLSAHNGGLLLVAIDEHEIIGFSVSFPAKSGDVWLLWSHITGVHPAYQGKGIGTTLKQRQRHLARENGYSAIGWTFDPMQAANAHFNLNILKAIGRRYHLNFYGEMRDSINNTGLPSDRMEIYWPTDDNERLEEPDTDTAILSLINEQLQLTDVLEDEPDCIRIPIPNNPAARKKWQPVARAAFQLAFDKGYVATHFVRGQQQYADYIMDRNGD